MGRTKESKNKVPKWRVRIYYRNGETSMRLFATKREANLYHKQVESEYDDNIRRSHGVELNV